MKKKVFYHIGRLNEKEEMKFDIKDSLSRSTSERIELGFIPMELPKIKDNPYRIFNNINTYRTWASKHLPKWLGYYIIND